MSIMFLSRCLRISFLDRQSLLWQPCTTYRTMQGSLRSKNSCQRLICRPRAILLHASYSGNDECGKKCRTKARVGQSADERDSKDLGDERRKHPHPYLRSRKGKLG